MKQSKEDTFEISTIARLLVDSVEEYALFVVDANGTIVSWNPGVRALLGYDKPEFIDRSVASLFSSETVAAAGEERVGARDAAQPVHRWFRRNDTSLVWCTGTVSALRDGDRILGYAYALRDGSDQRRFEREISDATRQQNRFLSTVSHELRTPLMAILGWIRVLQDGGLDSTDAQVALATIERNAMLQRRLIEDLLDCAKLVAGTLQLERDEVDVGGLVHEEIYHMRSLAAEKEIRLTAEIPSQPVSASVDAVRMRQVVGNLLSNAIKFTLDGGTVNLSLSSTEDSVVLRVADSGVGIDRDQMPHLFDRFGTATVEEPFMESGTGLGLCIAREIVELHGGTIVASSDGLGKGSTFTITIPRRV